MKRFDFPTNNLSNVVFLIKSRDVLGETKLRKITGKMKNSFVIHSEFVYVNFFCRRLKYIYIYFFFSLNGRTDAEASRRIISLPMAAVRGAWRGLDN